MPLDRWCARGIWRTPGHGAGMAGPPTGWDRRPPAPPASQCRAGVDSETGARTRRKAAGPDGTAGPARLREPAAEAGWAAAQSGADAPGRGPARIEEVLGNRRQ